MDGCLERRRGVGPMDLDWLSETGLPALLGPPVVGLEGTT